MVQVFSLVLLTEGQAEALLDQPRTGLFILLRQGSQLSLLIRCQDSHVLLQRSRVHTRGC